MIAAAEPYAPPQQESVPGSGSAARCGVRDVYFDGKFLPTQIYRRDRLSLGDQITGPAMITEYTSATVLPPCGTAQVDRFGNLVITFAEAE
jgi:N-methylhydantoinase A